MAEVELLEQGDLYFLYTPRVRPRPEPPFEADERVAGPRDVQRNVRDRNIRATAAATRWNRRQRVQTAGLARERDSLPRSAVKSPASPWEARRPRSCRRR